MSNLTSRNATKQQCLNHKQALKDMDPLPSKGNCTVQLVKFTPFWESRNWAGGQLNMMTNETLHFHDCFKVDNSIQPVQKRLFWWFLAGTPLTSCQCSNDWKQNLLATSFPWGLISSRHFAQSLSQTYADHQTPRMAVITNGSKRVH